jgi:hypothetical protein
MLNGVFNAGIDSNYTEGNNNTFDCMTCNDNGGKQRKCYYTMI